MLSHSCRCARWPAGSLSGSFCSKVSWRSFVCARLILYSGDDDTQLGIETNLDNILRARARRHTHAKQCWSEVLAAAVATPEQPAPFLSLSLCPLALLRLAPNEHAEAKLDLLAPSKVLAPSLSLSSRARLLFSGAIFRLPPQLASPPSSCSSLAAASAAAASSAAAVTHSSCYLRARPTWRSSRAHSWALNFSSHTVAHTHTRRPTHNARFSN